MLFEKYKTDGFYDEMFDESGGVRAGYGSLADRLNGLPGREIFQRQAAADAALQSQGITFSVYREGRGIDQTFPFDIIPRIITGAEWDRIADGLRQRIRALNLFLNDIYNDEKIIKAGVIPRELIVGSPGYRKECIGLRPPRDIWCHVTGVDLIRHSDGQVYVLEDNLRVPSGVGYVLGNRQIMKRTFPAVFEAQKVRPVADYPLHLLKMLQYIAPGAGEGATGGVLTPGMYNSAYFEHSFLAQQMGVQLLEGGDLEMANDRLMMRTTRGHEPVDVLYRRIDDDFLDPKVFRTDSVLGVPGIMQAYRAGKVAIANAPGTGVADDKVIYAYVPEMIKFYLNEETLLPNVPTYLCWDETQLAHVLANMESLVVKPANESGGYGILIGPAASRSEIASFKELVQKNPRGYIAQPVMSLSRVPTLIRKHPEGRHVDLRPFVIYGEDIYVMPGGLSRVALKKGSLIVNSSQGGGSKDTWITDADDAGDPGAPASAIVGEGE
ncbi:MAG: circularly permuted type 2 ATP-grasp protein [bacterium]|nr:circularly permuted type 2 ATP-grasp protein [bacterium]